MATSDLGTCEFFIGDLRRSNLLDRAQLDTVVEAYVREHPKAEPQQMADHLISLGLISPFQSRRLLVGNSDLLMGPFALLDELGSGSMGTVYKAVSKKDNTLYAVKVLPRRSMWDANKARRLVRSFEQCQHPGIVPFSDVGTQGNFHYLAWPLVEGGETLQHLVDRLGPLDPGVAALYGLQLAEALDVCHQVGLTHGLVKPSNVIVTADHTIKLLDSGVRLLLTDTELLDTMASTKLTGSLDCSSPESTIDPTKESPASDRYSLGCTIYFMLAGKYPFPEGGTRDKILAHQLKQATPLQEINPAIPAKLAAVVETLMQKASEARYSSTADVVTMLKPLANMSPPPHPGVPGANAESQPAATDGFETSNGSADAAHGSAAADLVPADAQWDDIDAAPAERAKPIAADVAPKLARPGLFRPHATPASSGQPAKPIIGLGGIIGLALITFVLMFVFRRFFVGH
jgi:serine/threonine protein kinase